MEDPFLQIQSQMVPKLSSNDIQFLLVEQFGVDWSGGGCGGGPWFPSGSSRSALSPYSWSLSCLWSMEDANSTPPWCKCGLCREMENPVERICCIRRPWVTLSGVFHVTVLNRSVLTVCILDRSDLFADAPIYTPASYRKAAYRQFILYEHGYLGRGNRKVVPSCVVWKVHVTCPAPGGIYLGYKEYWHIDDM